MDAEQFDYSVGETSLTKLVKYLQRENLILEIESIEHYIEILRNVKNDDFSLQMDERASNIVHMEKAIENYCIELN